jgi:predicted adenine nucleotide alpha hydrolase (AANH) superfamily ATPase
MEFEKKLQDARPKFYGINMNFKEGYESVMNECEREIEMFGIEQIKAMYKSVEPHRPCGAFCHR